MATPTYVPLGTYTVTGAAAASVTFSSIPATYRDLILIATHKNTTTGVSVRMRFNSDSGTNYYNVYMGGNGSTTFSGTQTASATIMADSNTTDISYSISQIMDYSATDKHKTQLSRGSSAAIGAIAIAGRWADTDAIDTVAVSYPDGGNLAIGSTFSLYGVN